MKHSTLRLESPRPIWSGLAVLALLAAPAAALSQQAPPEQPVQQPVQQPVEQPVLQPVPQPVPQPVATPQPMTPAAFPAPPLTTLSTSNVDTFMVLVPLRADADIRNDLTAARMREASAEVAVRQAKDVQARAKAHIEVKKKEIELTKSRIDAAKKAQNAVDAGAFESQKKVLELELKLLERRSQLYAAEVELGEAVRDAARSRAKACEREMDLALKRQEIAALSRGALSQGTVAQAVQMSAQLNDLEKKTLEAMRDMAGKEADTAQKEKKIAERRLAILEAQRTLSRQGQ